MKKIIGMGFILLFYLSSANALDLGVGAKAGINGVGLDLTVGLTKTLNLRFAASKVNIDDESESVTVGDSGAEGDIDAKLEFDFGSNAVLLDWHVFNGGFRLTAGMFKHTGAVDLSGRLESSIVVDGQPIDPSDINGDIGGEISLSDSYQPYVGIGWGRGAGGKGGFSFSADLGLAMLDPNVDLDANVNAGGNFANQDEFEASLKDLEKDAEDDLDDLEFWPVLAFGVNYAF